MDLHKACFFLEIFIGSVLGTDIEGYARLEGPWIPSLQRKQYSVNTVAECAAKCDRETNFSCRAFSYSDDDQICWIASNIQSKAISHRTSAALYKKIEECIRCRGEDYRGTVSITQRGVTCQRWDSQTPHNHDFDSFKRQERNLVENYCRNPDGEPRPWCYTTSDKKRDFCPIPYCTSEPLIIEPEMRCLTGRGEAYRGTISVTESGKTCQSWLSQRPHEHDRTPEKFSCKGLEGNYCRNPDDEKGPWCYTTDPNTRWEHCSVPSCGNANGPEECIHCTGEDYRGTISITGSGLTCQRWDSQTPHNHEYTSSRYPEENLVDNYCRNPGAAHRPWCYTTNRSKKWEFCSIPYCSSEPPTIEPEMTCITGKGRAYRGTISVTELGKTCQSWSAQRPHQHDRTSENYSCKGLERNYCRNPDNSERPWCYTTDPNTRWEYCSVPNCGDGYGPEECIHCNGEDYRGTISITGSGLTCQRWDSQTPHNHNYTSSRFPEENLVDNYCRNPGGGVQPWCYTTSRSKRWEYCPIPYCPSEPPTIEPEMTCITGKGRAYRGTISVTESGKTCQSWSAQSPHQHDRTSENYSCKGLQRNYCRNPDNKPKPWCYTTDPNSRWEYCNVPNCGHANGAVFASAAPERDCYEGDGSSYRGSTSETISGKTCQAWNSMTPHNHTNTPEKFPDADLRGNLCRNPTGESSPWCYTMDPEKRSEQCNLKKCSSQPLPPQRDCKEGNGATYRGPTSTTAKGVTCQLWRSQYPHRHYRFTPETHPDKGLDSNECRNPDNDEQGPWCYTTDRNTKWDYCRIPDCDCKEGNGTTYRGPTSVTKLGVTCQAWSSQSPHRHNSFTPQTHPENGLEGNNCRNPDNDGQGPWCYTTDGNKKWDYCQIPDCEL